MRPALLPYTFGMLAGVSVGGACTRYLENHCGNQQGDATCAERAVGRFCNTCLVDNDGCVDVMPVGECRYQGAGTGSSSGGSTSELGSSEGTLASETADSSSTGSNRTPCTMDEQCTAEMPFCDDDSGECVRCDETGDPDGSCLARDPLLPLCVEGECVSCTFEDPAVCDAQLLVCDDATHACAPCTEHEQCASGACDLVPRTCFPSDVVVHVDGDGGRDFTRVGDAVAAVSGGAQGVIIVHELDDGSGYEENVFIGGAKRVALLAAPGENPTITASGSGSPPLWSECCWCRDDRIHRPNANCRQ